MRKKRFDKKILIIVLVVFCFVLGSIKINYLKLEELTHEVGMYFQKKILFDRDKIDNKVIDGINYQLEDEVNELRKMLELDINNYKFIHANIIKRENDWYNELVINKGKNDGINLDMAVISNNTLIGRVVDVTKSSSVVRLITSNSNDMKVSVVVKGNNDNIYGLIDGYIENEGLIKVNSILKTANIKVGDSIYTSGLGDVYPEGIYIGEVVKIEDDSLGLSKILKIKNDTSYNNIKYVSVIDRS